MITYESNLLSQFKKDFFLVVNDLNLEGLPTKLNVSKKNSIEKHLRKTRRKLGDLQNTIYAHSKYSVLVCLQGMDTTGKDRLIRKVFKDFNVRGVTSYSFKKPSDG